MEFSIVATLEKRKKTDLLVIPFWKMDKSVKEAASAHSMTSQISPPQDVKDFGAKEGEVLMLYPKGFLEERVALLGLGEEKKVSIEILRRAYAQLIKSSLKKNIQSINLLMPEAASLNGEQVAFGIAEGMLLANYVYEDLKGESFKEKTALIKKAVFVGGTTKSLGKAKYAALVCEGVYLARNLINGNADDVTPQKLAATAKDLEKKFKGVKATVFDKKRIEKEQMGLLLAVGRGSSIDPAFIILEYTGDPKNKERTVVVGKGVTYDTGGLSLKPTSGMLDMKCDMSGAAAALGTIYAAANTGLKKNVTAVIPATENSIGSRSYKPGDIYKSFFGKTVEIGNADAEGRLILADALAYVEKNLKPSCIIDFATLTGAIVVALGEEASGLMSNDDALSERLRLAGESTYERVWRLPLFEEYKPQLESDFADINNVGGKEASSITAALFLQEFVEKTPWAHLDIAGTAHLSKARRYHPKHGTGVGVRLMMEFLSQM